MYLYEPHELRQVQEAISTSPADQLYIGLGPVPAGKIWTILSAHCYPSANQTQLVWGAIQSRSTRSFAVTALTNNALGANVPQALIIADELKLLPGEYFNAMRAVATAGSTWAIAMRYVESDLEYAAHKEILNPVVRSKIKRGGPIGGGGGGGGATGGGATGGGAIGGGRERSAEPI